MRSDLCPHPSTTSAQMRHRPFPLPALLPRERQEQRFPTQPAPVRKLTSRMSVSARPASAAWPCSDASLKPLHAVRVAVRASRTVRCATRRQSRSTIADGVAAVVAAADGTAAWPCAVTDTAAVAATVGPLAAIIVSTSVSDAATVSAGAYCRCRDCP